jgi:hypothetical protein
MMLGNPLVRPWVELAEIAKNVRMSEYLFGAYYICQAKKPLARERQTLLAVDRR